MDVLANRMSHLLQNIGTGLVKDELSEADTVHPFDLNFSRAS